MLQDAYGGFLGAQLVPDFAAYARSVTTALGDRVTYWTTFNEPNSICSLGFGTGQMAPGILSPNIQKCTSCTSISSQVQQLLLRLLLAAL